MHFIHLNIRKPSAEFTQHKLEQVLPKKSRNNLTLTTITRYAQIDRTWHELKLAINDQNLPIITEYNVGPALPQTNRNEI